MGAALDTESKAAIHTLHNFEDVIDDEAAEVWEFIQAENPKKMNIRISSSETPNFFCINVEEVADDIV